MSFDFGFVLTLLLSYLSVLWEIRTKKTKKRKSQKRIKKRLTPILLFNEVMDEEPESNSSVKFQTCVLCFAGIASIIIVWIFIPDFAMQFTLFAIPTTGFGILAVKKGWLKGMMED